MSQIEHLQWDKIQIIWYLASLPITICGPQGICMSSTYYLILSPSMNRKWPDISLQESIWRRNFIWKKILLLKLQSWWEMIIQNPLSWIVFWGNKLISFGIIGILQDSIAFHTGKGYPLSRGINERLVSAEKKASSYFLLVSFNQVFHEMRFCLCGFIIKVCRRQRVRLIPRWRPPIY